MVAAPLAFGCALSCSVSSEVEPWPDTQVVAMRDHGRELFTGRGGCIQCHSKGTLGDKVRGPNLGEGHRTAAYVAAQIVDPEAIVFEGYARGVMKPPDEPPINLSDDDIVSLALFISGEDDAAGARAAIAPARQARERRARKRHVDQVISRVKWSEGDAARGSELFSELGCPACHDNPRNPQTHAPCLHVAAARLTPENMARWLLAPPRTKMPSYEQILGPAQVADLVEFLQLGLPERIQAEHAAAGIQ